MADRNWKQAERSRRQNEELAKALEDLTDEQGYPPTREELAQRMGVSVDTVARTIKRMKRDGQILDDGPRTLRLPF